MVEIIYKYIDFNLYKNLIYQKKIKKNYFKNLYSLNEFAYFKTAE